MTYAQMYSTSFPFPSDLYAFFLFVPCQACSGEQSDYLTPFLGNSGACQL